MSLINDALKQAQKTQSQPMPPVSVSPLRPSRLPLTAAPAPQKSWLVAVLVVALIIAAIVIIGLASSRRSTLQKVVAPAPLPAAQSVTATAQPAATMASVAPAPTAPPAVVAEPVPEAAPVAAAIPEELPKLQGIFYSPTSPSAILDGHTVRPGDRFLQYRIKEITKFTVTLTKPDGNAIKLNMN